MTSMTLTAVPTATPTVPTVIDTHGNLVRSKQVTSGFAGTKHELIWKLEPGTYLYDDFPLAVTDTDGYALKDEHGQPLVKLGRGAITIKHTSYIVASLSEPTAEPCVITCEKTLAAERRAKQERQAAARRERDKRWMAKAVLVGSR